MKKRLLNKTDAVCWTVELEILDDEVTEQMRAASDRFWQLLIGRVIIAGKVEITAPDTKNQK